MMQYIYQYLRGMAMYNLRKSQDDISLINRKPYKLDFQKQHKLCNFFFQKLIKLIQKTGNKLCLCYVQENYPLVIYTTSNIFKGAQFTRLLDNKTKWQCSPFQ